MNDIPDAIKEAVDTVTMAMAMAIAEHPLEAERIRRDLAKALKDQPMLLCVTSLADTLSAGLTGLSADDKTAVMLAFTGVALQMAEMRDRGMVTGPNWASQQNPKIRPN